MEKPVRGGSSASVLDSAAAVLLFVDLLDVKVDLRFTSNRMVYLSYVEPGEDETGRQGHG